MKNVTEKLFLFLIPLLFTFPIFKESISSSIVILLILNTIVFHLVRKQRPVISWSVFLLTIPFWSIVFHSLLSNKLVENEAHIRHALFFLTIPICFSLIPTTFFSKEKLHFYLAILKNICLLIGLIYLVGFFLHHDFKELFVVFQNVSSFRNYVYNDFKIIQIHPTYYTSILVFCSVYCFDCFLKQKKYFDLFYIFFFLLISFLLLSKLNILFLVVCLLGMQLFRSDTNFRKKILLTSGLIVFIGTLAVFTPGIKDRFNEVFTSLKKQPLREDYDSTNIRKAIFDCSISLIKSDCVFGVGFNNIQDRLNTCYQENYYSNFYYENQYMTHNYFFYILISSGVFGFLFFMLYVLQIVRVAFQIRCFVFSVFLINILLMSLIEDFMYRHYGGLFFNIILLLFIRHHEHLKTAVAQK
jgi:hypothetical protein